MAIPDKAAIEVFKRAHGDELKMVVFDKKAGIAFVVRPPTPVEYQRFIDRAAEGARQRVEAMCEMAESCVIHPDEKEAKAFYDRKPAATTTLAGHVLELAGIIEEQSEKLLPPCFAKRAATTSSPRAR